MAKKKVPVEQDMFSVIKQGVDDSIALTQKWEQDNVKWYKMRYRIKKKKTFPFVGCSNIRMPTIETKIRKLKAALTNVIFGIRPVVQAIPSPSGNYDTSIKIEKFLDHLIMDVIKLKPSAIMGIDRTLEKGFYLYKPYWKTEIITRIENYSIEDLSMQEVYQLYSLQTTEDMIGGALVEKFGIDLSEKVARENRIEIEHAISDIQSGKTEITLNLQDVLYDYPAVALCEPEKTYVDGEAGVDPQTADFIVHEFELDYQTIKLNGEIKGWDVDEILEMKDTAERAKVKSNTSDYSNRELDIEKDTREGIDRLNKSNKIKIWEYYGWYDIKGDGTKVKCVITCAPDFNKVLRKIALPFYSGKYPFVKTYYELTDDRWFSHRGIPELIEDIVKEIDMQHMQKLDSQTMRNTPMFTHRAGMVNKNTIQFIFGQSIPVSGMQPLDDIIKPINNNNSNVEFSYEREQMLLETKVEELIGQVDFTLQSMINKRQPRTLGEVEMQNQNMQQVFSLDADMFRESFQEIFSWIWELWCQYGDDEYEFSYFGREGYEKIKLTKEEVQGKYKIKVRGNDQNTNPQVKMQKAQMAYNLTQNQALLQMGVIKPQHLASIVDYLLKELDVPDHERLHEDPQAMLQQMQQQAQQPPPIDVKVNMDDLTDAEAAQVLAQKGIKPDIQGRALKSAAKVQEKEVSLSSAKADNIKKIFDAIGETDAKEEMDAPKTKA